jgi:(2S)-methylsuccinyl-CoA dehydrogenase
MSTGSRESPSRDSRRLGELSDLDRASDCLELAAGVVEAARLRLSRTAGGKTANEDQVVAYDLSHAAAAVETARAALGYGRHGPLEASLAAVFVGDVVADIAARTAGREELFGTEPGWHRPAAEHLALLRSPEAVASLATTPGHLHLDPDFEMVRDAFRRFAEEKIAPVAERIHRENGDVPEEIIAGLAEMGGFGLSIPERYGGFATGGGNDYLGMVVATEELSRASLGAGGALITRPEILSRALLNGGTDDQRQALLPRIATGEAMVAVAVTEPDYGSDVASLTTSATPSDKGGYILNGVKTWCTFAARAELLMLLARTEPDRSMGHRGLSLFVVEKERAEPTGFRIRQREGESGRPSGLGEGSLEGRPIDTLGYRGMHSYELAFDDWWVPDESLVGGESARGQGFYLQMAGFENGRLQTAARAVGVMQAAYEAAASYAEARKVFGRPIAEYQLTAAKLGRMAAVIQASRQFAYDVAGKMAAGGGSLEASMVKAYVCRAAEWVTREAMQIHGGMGYAEEFPVSRLFVDARVLSIFEGADETLCLRVIARRLVSEPAG